MTTTLKLVPYSPLGTADITLVTQKSVTLTSRAQAPYPPGNVKINGVAFPTTTTGDLVFTWNHRWRFGPNIVKQDAGDVVAVPEGTYEVKYYIGATLIRTYSAGNIDTFSFSSAQRQTDDPDLTKLTTFVITPINGALRGTPRSLTVHMTGILGGTYLSTGRYEFTLTSVGGLFV